MQYGTIAIWTLFLWHAPYFDWIVLAILILGGHLYSTTIASQPPTGIDQP